MGDRLEIDEKNRVLFKQKKCYRVKTEKEKQHKIFTSVKKNANQQISEKSINFL